MISSFRTTHTAVLALAIFCLLIAADSALAGKVAVDKGTPVEIRFDLGAKVSSKTAQVGDTVGIKLASPIIIGGQVIVDEGTEGKAVVSEVKGHGMVGKPGQITVNFVSLEAKGAFHLPENQMIPLNGSITVKGKGKKILSILFIAGLLIKGGHGEVDTGKTYQATVAANTILEN